MPPAKPNSTPSHSKAIGNELIALGERVRIARKARSLSQIDLAQQADIGLSTLKDIEAGRGGVSLVNLFKALEALGLLAHTSKLAEHAQDPQFIARAAELIGG